MILREFLLKNGFLNYQKFHQNIFTNHGKWKKNIKKQLKLS